MKRILSVIILICTVLSLTALSSCHGSKTLNEFVIPDEFDSSKNYEIVFWAKNDTNKAQTNVYQKAIEDFQKLYPNVTVKLRLYTDYTKIYNDVITNIATGTTPDVCITYPDHIATYLTGTNVVVPLEGLFDNEKYGFAGSELKFDSPARNEVIGKYLDECAFGEHYYAIPFMRSTEACYINKTFVEKLGFTLPDVLTWDFVWEVSEAATKKNADGIYEVNGQSTMIPFIYKSTDNMLISQLKQKEKQTGENNYSDSEGNMLIFNDTTKSLLLETASHVPSGAFSTFKISSYPANFLNAGQCIFAIDSTAGATWMGPHAPLLDISEDQLVDFEIAVRAIPQFDENSLTMISQGPSICVFNKRDNGQVLASWLFAQYLLTNDIQIGYAQTEGYVPVTEKARNAEEYSEYLSLSDEFDSKHYSVKIQATALLLENTENTFTTPVFNGSASLRGAAEHLVESTVKTVRRGEIADSGYIDGLYSDTVSLYHLDSISSSSAEKAELGPLPATAVVLLVSIVLAWAVIGVCYFIRLKKSKKED